MKISWHELRRGYYEARINGKRVAVVQRGGSRSYVWTIVNTQQSGESWARMDAVKAVERILTQTFADAPEETPQSGYTNGHAEPEAPALGPWEVVTAQAINILSNKQSSPGLVRVAVDNLIAVAREADELGR